MKTFDECEEVAAHIKLTPEQNREALTGFDACRRVVRSIIGDETQTIIDNVTDAVWDRLTWPHILADLGDDLSATRSPELTSQGDTQMLQAIQTRYLPPTNHRVSRVKAFCDAGSVTVSWDYSLSPEANHLAAALELLGKLDWPTDGLRGGALPNDSGYVFVQGGAQ